jgi:hypothetical protein
LISNDVRNGNRKVCLVLVRKKEKKKKVDPAIAPISPGEKKEKKMNVGRLPQLLFGLACREEPSSSSVASPPFIPSTSVAFFFF